MLFKRKSQGIVGYFMHSVKRKLPTTKLRLKGLILLFFSLQNSLVARSNPTPVTPLEPLSEATMGNFFWSLGVGATIGLGLGHAVQGRYGEEGGFFTISEIGALVVMGAGLIECSSPGDYLFFKSPDFTPSGNAGCRLIKGGSLALIGLKIFEVLDLFQGIPVWHRAPEQITLAPTLLPNNELGLSLGLKF
jgi:hypothetical protein